jgi:glycosyltransferase involved in cell wall biosynthesis
MEPTRPSSSPGNYRQQWGLVGKIVFFYGGNIGIAQDMDNLLRLAESLKDDDGIRFVIVGDGSEVVRIKKVIAHKALPNFQIRPSVGQDEYLKMVPQFDIGLLSLDRNLRTQNFPGKMLSYMDAGIPILASINPGNDLKSVVERGQFGLVSLNGDDSSLRTNALRLAQDPELRHQMGERGRVALESIFSVRRAASQILSRGRRLLQPSI